MDPYHVYRSGFRLLLACLFLGAFGTSCTSESFRGESGSGYKMSIAVAPSAALSGATLAALLTYFVWRRSSKR
jgi:hypothetical protein